MRLVRLTELKIGVKTKWMRRRKGWPWAVTDTTSACCGKTVMAVRRMDTGVNTAEEGCEMRSAAALQA